MRELLSIPAFRALWLGQAISRLGDGLYFIGFLFMVRKVTGSDAMVGYVGAVEALPYLLLGPYAGTLADRIDRKRIMLVSDAASGGLLLVLAGIAAVAGSPPLWSLFVFGFLLSCARVFFMPAKNAAVPNLVPEERLMAANSFAVATDQSLWLVSMAFSGAALAALYSLDRTLFYLSFMGLNALSFFGSALFIAKLPPIVAVREGTASGWADVLEGVRYVRTRRFLVLTLLAQVGITLSISPFFVVYLASNEKWFGGSPRSLALIEVGFMAGMILVSLLVMRRRIERVGLAYSFGLGVGGFAVAMMAFFPTLWVFLLWNFAAGLAIGFVDLPTQTYTQATVPDAFRGRVMSLKGLLMMGLQPVGMALGGWFLKSFGVEAMYVAIGTGFGLSGMLPLLSRTFRETRMPALGSPAEVPEPDAPESGALVPGGATPEYERV